MIIVILSITQYSVYIMAEPEINIDKKYYYVSGQTAEEIRQDMNTKRLHFGDGSHDAYTKWHVSWKFWWQKTNKTCMIKKVKTKVEIKSIFPKLLSTSGMNDALICKWKSYKKQLMRHEDSHKDFGINAAIDIEDAIINLSSSFSCNKLEAEANELGHNIIERYRQLEINYDHETNYGINKGAEFP